MSTPWPVKTLGELCEFRNGLWKGKKPPFIEAGVIRNTNFNKDGTLDYSNIAYLNVEEKQFAKRQLVYGDIILEKSGGGPKQPVGRVVIFDKKEGYYSFSNFTSIIRIIDPSALYFRYLHYVLYWYYISGVTEGMQRRSTGIRNLDFTAYKSVKIPLPSLDEQLLIVSILDEALANIENNSKHIQSRINDSNELFKSTLNEIFSTPNNDWNKVKLNEITTKIGSGATPRGGKKSYKTEGVSLIRSMNIHDKYFKHKDLAFIDESQAAKLSNVIVESNDVLLNITGASVARCNLAPQEIIPARVNQHVMIIRPIHEMLNPRFLHFMLISKPYKDKLLSTGEQGGTTRQAITKSQVENFEICYPPLIQEQGEIVARIILLLKETEKLELAYYKKLGSMDELKKSILQEAFNGNL